MEKVVKLTVFYIPEAGWYWTDKVTGPFETKDEAWDDAEKSMFGDAQIEDGGTVQ
jgi:hypothetical protein